MTDTCLICSAPIAHSDTKTHYVCNHCRATGMDEVFSVCLNAASKSPIHILEELMSLPVVPMHGPIHHVLVGAALLTAYRNAGGDLNLPAALSEIYKRGTQVPGGACGFWGACGAGVSAGMFLSIVTNSSPLAHQAWGLSNQMTASALHAIGQHGGPRCCKRDSYLAVSQAVSFTAAALNIHMELPPIACSRSSMNPQCLQKDCPFYQSPRKKVAFICVHNSCRSQIAEALGKHLASDTFDSYSAGTETKPAINPDAVRLMKELYGIDMEKTQYSKLLKDIPQPDLAISMGCNVSCPFIGRDFDDNWNLDDPTGKSDEDFKYIIQRIEENILRLKQALS